jgi:hypothetical protein
VLVWIRSFYITAPLYGCANLVEGELLMKLLYKAVSVMMISSVAATCLATTAIAAANNNAIDKITPMEAKQAAAWQILTESKSV